MRYSGIACESAHFTIPDGDQHTTHVTGRTVCACRPLGPRRTRPPPGEVYYLPTTVKETTCPPH
eukprot:6017116-Prymnesium_polylepis.1